MLRKSVTNVTQLSVDSNPVMFTIASFAHVENEAKRTWQGSTSWDGPGQGSVLGRTAP